MLAVTHRFSPLAVLPWRTWALAGLLSTGMLVFATSNNWPVWLDGIAVLVPWLPLLAVQTAWTYRRYQWLALFYALVVGQTGHFLEHVSQMIQIHVLGLTGADASGIFGALNIEWVHFTWNTWVIATVFTLLFRYPANRWLWATAVLAGWHEIEHAFIFYMYMTTDVAGTPGLLSQGGALGGGLPITRPDLHFIYNLVETAPLTLAFLFEVRRINAPTNGRERVAAVRQPRSADA